MPTTADHRYSLRRADWERDQAALRAVRLSVFVREQQVPEALEWDGRDDNAVHLIAESEDGAVIGTARLLPSGQIGRWRSCPTGANAASAPVCWPNWCASPTLRIFQPRS